MRRRFFRGVGIDCLPLIKTSASLFNQNSNEINISDTIKTPNSNMLKDDHQMPAHFKAFIILDGYDSEIEIGHTGDNPRVKCYQQVRKILLESQVVT